MKGSRSRIMVVDDDPAMLRAVERILAPVHEVRSFDSGQEALQALRGQEFNVAIVDIRMPGMDGFELTRAIKSEYPKMEVVLVTGSVTDLDDKLVRSVKERAGFFITKPFTRAVLSSIVDRSLEIQKLEIERDELIERLTADLARARRYQLALFPKDLPRFYGPIEVAASHVTCEAVGGDIYDVIPLPDGRLLLVVADVVGHGVAAALVTGMIKTALNRTLQTQPELVLAAQAVTDSLAPLSQQRVVTLILAMVDARGKTIQYLNAGHPPALIWSEGTKMKTLDATTPLLSFGLGLGAQPVASTPFQPGDRLALYTDGLYEMRDPGGREYGRERLLRALARRRGSIVEVTASTMEVARRHAGGRPTDDDLTLLMAEFHRG
ncbi:MAG TPA: SpoIIE family protein phosphatase [Candidatus Polarisedimenticolia bacterium]|nr:SpoIIE family protein phosphatase [Candidatus Polarisedimenticolia bacterium]